MNLGGRPTKCTKETTDEICRRISSGESLSSVCRDENMPSISVVLSWVVNDRDGFQDRYRKAREAQGYFDADKIRNLADMTINGELEPQVAKVAIDAYKWTAARNAAKVYGDKQQVDHSSSDGTMKTYSPSDYNSASERLKKAMKGLD
ncbi:terminase small subunit-like protein [Candidatus Enterovibrio escicola]|uniref:terminase small subunit-like protein n=1 Tax=Candidatus Enterovibrio escicola TaxID=1927127 RepID=UPI001237E09C|nr:hypothetical protein [Candidatus Enterovibrio escacola]